MFFYFHWFSYRFIKKFIIPDKNDTNIWNINNYTLLILNLNVNKDDKKRKRKEDKKKKTYKKDKDDKDEDDKEDEKENNEVIYFEPNF